MGHCRGQGKGIWGLPYAWMMMLSKEAVGGGCPLVPQNSPNPGQSRCCLRSQGRCLFTAESRVHSAARTGEVGRGTGSQSTHSRLSGRCGKDAVKVCQQQLHSLVLLGHVCCQAPRLPLWPQQCRPEHNADVLSCHAVNICPFHHPGDEQGWGVVPCTTSSPGPPSITPQGPCVRVPSLWQALVLPASPVVYQGDQIPTPATPYYPTAHPPLGQL